ncbi:hypothetical protein VSDG_03441 [Cytospora chrysosperma]|uniref:Uncharacterized protein n=1 Tax=Cytospora chrysosperma TaxID=252740 RepID=A0A423W9X5_CYTCH|nr:hypothetical protein VSDG_03441 [Valsa sordida]
MPRYSGWGGGWPFMYMHQPGGWGEQTWGMGFGSRNNSSNNNNNNNNNNSTNLFPPCADLNSPNTLNIDNLSGLFARLILQNHLTRLAEIGCHGGALYGCSPPSSSSSSPSSAPHNSHSHAHNHHNCHGGGNNNNINNNAATTTTTTSSSTRCQVCVHTCPVATQPYMATNNVFVIPAAHVQQQQQQQQQQQSHQHPHQQPPHVPGLAGASMDNISMFLSGLGLALGGASNNMSGCGGGGGGVGPNLPPGFGFPGLGAGAAQVSLNSGGFSCAACCNHIRM